MTLFRRTAIAATVSLLVLPLGALVHAPSVDLMLVSAWAAGKPTDAVKTSPAPPANPAAIPPSKDAAKDTAKDAGKNGAPAANTAGAAPPVLAPPVLPPPVSEMREAILAAVYSGRIDDLAIPMAWNEMKPEIAAKADEDAIAYLKAQSGDGQGRELLAVMGRILEMRPARVAAGGDVENSAVFVWPYLAEADLSTLRPEQEVELYRLVTPAEAKAMRDKKKWTWWRLVIGADGTWHAFHKRD